MSKYQTAYNVLSSFEHNGRRFQLRTEYDQDTEAPWEHSDGHGVISEWERRDKRPSERILREDHGLKMFYDVQATIAIALRDGWDAEPYNTGTKGEQAARAVNADFEYCRAWANDEWRYIGVIVTDERGEDRSIWSVEDFDAAYIESLARELADDLIAEQDALLEYLS